MRVFKRAIVPLLLILQSACSASTPGEDAQEPYPIERRIHVRDMPSRLIEVYEAQGKAEYPNAGYYYRAGTLETDVAVYQTSRGTVYVDFGGGGMAFAMECAAITEFQRRNGWSRASGCEEGSR